MAHQSLEELSLALAHAAELVTVGAHYAHYKHPEQYYLVQGFAIQEADEAVVVIYESQYGDHVTFTRPLSSWMETIESNGDRVPRFVRVDDEAVSA
jgi:hypothetical protein